ncbi:protein spaetzle-like isoform X5 [Toxorhynchites rutilus septentrionalis]|uniref:protein spaetzle-like isoform X5 n=1 Tax=Toxorhynchites rutilus septentrionalis TaxID=329112 RepID=UPI00247A5D0D|nr:protein spaetzle-like isoform X5 [Toxorhynchites rutilus septentrionalis]
MSMDNHTVCQHKDSKMIRRIPWSIWLPSGLMIIIMFLCMIIMLLITSAFPRTQNYGSSERFVVGSAGHLSKPTDSASEFRSLIRPRTQLADNGETPSVDEDVEKKIREIYARGYSDPDPTSEEYPDQYPQEDSPTSTVRSRPRRPLQPIDSINKGDIVFPVEWPPSITSECGPETPICVNIPNYPKRFIDNIIARQEHRFSEVFGDDVVVASGDKLVQRFDATDDEFICKSEEKLIHPQGGLSMDNKQVVVVNTEKYNQGVRVELCSSPGQTCEALDHLTSLYRTECKQLYHYRTLLAVHPKTGELYKETIRLPSCCKCVIKPLRRP